MLWDRHCYPNPLLRYPERALPWSSSNLTRSSSPSSNGSHSDIASSLESSRAHVVLGVCAMDVKARSKPMREILTRIVELARDAIEVKIFGDKVILDEGDLMFSTTPSFYILMFIQTSRVGRYVTY